MVMDFEKHRKFVRYIQNKVEHGLRNCVLVLAAGVILGGFLSYSGYVNKVPYMLVIGIILIAFGIGYCAFMTVHFNSQLNKGWNVKHTVAGEIRVRVVLYEDHLLQITNYAKTELYYDKVKKAYETHGFIYLMISDKRAVIIEKKECSKKALEFLRETFVFS